uniref:Pentatricopeptide repeat-containing protein n=1 Tax=Zea mays TaxID=4577 RepID=A0A804RGV9_MAIZE
MSFDNFVQITGGAEAVKKALFGVSTIIYKHPSKENIPLETSIPDPTPSIIIPSELPVYPASNFYSAPDAAIPSVHPSLYVLGSTRHVPELAVPADDHVSCPKMPDKKSEHGVSRLHFLEERDEETLSRRLIKLSQNNKVRSATELFDSMRTSGLQPSAHACNSLLPCYVHRSPLADAMRMFEFMKAKGMATGHTYTLILKAVASNQGYVSALEMFNKIEEEEDSKKIIDVIVYNTMIYFCGRAKEWMLVERLWRRLEQHSLNGTLLAYDLLDNIFVQCGQSELAIAAYQEMLQKGLDPSEDIMKAIIASCTKEGKWEFAMSTFSRMMRAGMNLGLILFNSIINSLGKDGQDELAFRMYHLLKQSGLKPDQYTWITLLLALYRLAHLLSTPAARSPSPGLTLFTWGDEHCGVGKRDIYNGSAECFGNGGAGRSLRNGGVASGCAFTPQPERSSGVLAASKRCSGDQTQPRRPNTTSF